MRNIIAVAVPAVIYILAVLLPVPLLSAPNATGDGLEIALLYTLWISAFGAGAAAISIFAFIAWFVSKCQSRNWATLLCGSQMCLASGFATLAFLMGNILIGVLAALYAAALFAAVFAINNNAPQTE